MSLWTIFDSVRPLLIAKFQEFALLDKPTDGLITAKNSRCKKFGKPYKVKSNAMQPNYLFYNTDGHLLFAHAGADKNQDQFINAGTCYIFAFIIGFLILVGNIGGDMPTDAEILYPVFAILITIGIVLHGFSWYAPATGFVVFDRDNGTVMFPPHWRKKTLVLAFNQIDCRGRTSIYSRGGIHYNTYICAKQKHKNELHPRREEIRMGIILTRTEAEALWNVIIDFMNREKPIPDIIPLYDQIQWYKDNNTSIREYFKEPAIYDDRQPLYGNSFLSKNI